MKKILITGANSYIGTSFEKYAYEKFSSQLSIETVDMIDGSWRNKDFSSYDIVFHVAGLAHADVGNVSEETKKKYYAVNTDLAIECCKKAKSEGVKQFVFMSSAIIYGDSAPYGKKKIITKDTEPTPANFYGDSKWQAEIKLRELDSEAFHIAILRPPMIYGEGCKGNYNGMHSIAMKVPCFPDFNNLRSVLFIGNLCEFIRLLVEAGNGGIFWPQNKEQVKTSDFIREISKAHGKKRWITRGLNWLVPICAHIPGKVSKLANKAFGSLYVDNNMSNAFDGKYQIFSFSESIRKTEKV